jgi:hypothetical protein
MLKHILKMVEEVFYKTVDRRFDYRLGAGNWFFFNVPNPSGRAMAPGFTRPLTETRSRKIMFLGVKSGRRVRLTTSPPSVSRLSIQCEILNISQPHRPPQPVTWIALLYCLDNVGSLTSHNLIGLHSLLRG